MTALPRRKRFRDSRLLQWMKGKDDASQDSYGDEKSQAGPSDHGESTPKEEPIPVIEVTRPSSISTSPTSSADSDKPRSWAPGDPIQWNQPKKAETVESHEPEPVEADRAPSFWEQAELLLKEENKDIYEAFQEMVDSGEDTKVDEQLRNQALLRSADETLRRITIQMDKASIQQSAIPAKIGARTRDREMRSQLDTIVKYLKLVKDNGKSLAELDPSGWAKIAWIPIGILLELATLSLENYNQALEAFSKLSGILHIYAEIEQNYRHRDVRHPKFEERLIEVYAVILECEVLLARIFSRNVFSKCVRAIPGMDNWKQRMTNLDEKDLMCRGLIEALDSKLIIQTEKGVTTLVKAHEVQELERLLRWISPHNPSTVRYRVLRQTKLDTAFPNAGSWLLEDDAYVKWELARPAGISPLWLHGPVGCGKTCLTTRVIEQWLEELFQNPTDQIAYYYCSKAGGSGSETLDIFRALLRQLAWSIRDSQLFPCIQKHWAGRMFDDEPTLMECTELLLEILELNSHMRVVIIIDALDECADPMEVLQTLQSLHDPLKKTSSVVKLFISSRNNVPVDHILEEELTDVNIDRWSIAKDMRRFIDYHTQTDGKRLVDFMSNDDEGPELLQRLEDILVDRAGVGFRWAQLQLQVFFKKNVMAINASDIKERLDRLEKMSTSAQLTQVYREIYEDNTASGPNAKRHLQQILIWMLGRLSSRPPSIEFICQAIVSGAEGADVDAPPVEKKYLRLLVSNLLIFDRDGRTPCLRFAHLSVKEFFTDPQQFSEALTVEEARIEVAAICLRYVMKTGLSVSSHDTLFRRSAVYRWGDLCARVGKEGRNTQPLKPLFEKMTLEGIPVASIEFPSHRDEAPYCRIPQTSEVTLDPFFAACYYNFSEVVESTIQHRPGMLKNRTQFNFIQDTDWTHDVNFSGLWLAMMRRNTDVVDIILNSVRACCHSDDIDIATAFIKMGVDVNEKGNCQYDDYVTHVNPDWDFELESRKSWELSDAKERGGSVSLLEFSLKEGQIELAHLLLDAGAQVNGSSRSWCTPLAIAVDDRDVAMTERLLKLGADPNSNVFEGRRKTILSGLMWTYDWKPEPIEAQKDKNAALLELLLAAGLEPNFTIGVKTYSEDCPLLAAAMDGNTRMVKLLLDAGADPNLYDVAHFGRTALSCACIELSLPCVELLLAAGAQVNPDPEVPEGERGRFFGHTPLDEAVNRNLCNYPSGIDEGRDFSEQQPICRMLLEAGALPTSLGIWDQAFSLARSEGWDDVLELLEKRDTTVIAPSERLERIGQEEEHQPNQQNCG